MLTITILAFCFPSTILTLGIIGGYPETRESSFFVIIVTKNLDTCGGTIIADDAVLTAAQCLFNAQTYEWIPNNDLRILTADFRRTNWQERMTRYFCSYYTIHYDFNPTQELSPYDLAVIKTTRNLIAETSQTSILTPCPHTQDDSHGIAIGIGTVSMTSREPATSLRSVLLLRKGIAYCNRIAGAIGATLTDEQFICYGSSPPRVSVAGTSIGDTGGPVLDASGTCFIGVSTFAAVSSDGNEQISVFTRADFFGDWIREAVVGPIIISL